MPIEAFRKYCLSKIAATEEMPFGPETLAFKVQGKIFALAALDEAPLRVNLKCNPERAVELREKYDGIIIPGYHMNKKHWNTIILDGRLRPEFVSGVIDHSYELVVKSLPKKKRQELEK